MKYKVGDRVKYGSEICTVTKILESQGKFKYRVQSDTWFDIVNEDEITEGLVEEETKPEPKFKVGDSVEVLKSGNVYTISQMKFNGKEFVYTLSNNGSTVSCFSEEEIEFTEEDKYWCDIMSESDPTTYVLPQGYQFKDENGNVINATRIVLERKKKEYTKGTKVHHKTKGMVETIVGLCKVKAYGIWMDGVIYEGNDVETGGPMTFVRTKEDFENNFEII